MNPLIPLKHANPLLLTAGVLACLVLLPTLQAISPPPDGGYAGGNTAEGQNALFSLTSGRFNTALGFLSLSSDTTNSFNTAIGAGTLLANTADSNTAIGAGALLSNTIGAQNTANGAFALNRNTTGSSNTAVGSFGGSLSFPFGDFRHRLREAVFSCPAHWRTQADFGGHVMTLPHHCYDLGDGSQGVLPMKISR